jgi:hypothetical protein
MIDLSTNIHELPLTKEEDLDGQNQRRNEIVMQSVERFREALKNLGTGDIYRRVVLEGKVTKEATLGEQRMFPMDNVDEELFLKVLAVYSKVKWR